MKSKIFVGLLCLFAGTFLLWDLNVAFGSVLAAMGISALVEVFTHNASRRYQLTAIEGTFRATAEGGDLHQVERELAEAMKNWQTGRP
jgi:hypothetical protein